MINDVSDSILIQTCRVIKKGKLPRDFVISVNISPRQMRSRELFDDIKQIIEKQMIFPDQLEVEMTENSLIENFDIATETLFKLKELGVKISIDDFGVGYSSLNYLARFPIDSIKLDKSFISNLNNPEAVNNNTVVKCIVDMAHALNLKVVAEGVETEEQFNYLKSISCDYIQGYYFSKPMDEEKLLNFLK